MNNLDIYTLAHIAEYCDCGTIIELVKINKHIGPLIYGLDARNCTSITDNDLKMFPNIEMLNCSFCDNITNVEKFTKLTSLKCNYCNIGGIDTLVNLTSLKCKYTEININVEKLVNLTSLDRRWSPNIIGVEKLHKLTNLKNTPLRVQSRLGGLMSLVGYGSQDIYLTSQHDINIF